VSSIGTCHWLIVISRLIGIMNALGNTRLVTRIWALRSLIWRSRDEAESEFGRLDLDARTRKLAHDLRHPAFQCRVTGRGNILP